MGMNEPRASVASNSRVDRTSRLRVLYVLDSLGPGGTERSTALLLGPLRDLGVDGEVVCLRHVEDGDEARVVRDGFAVTILRSTSAPSRIMELRRHIRIARPDVLHTAIFNADILGRLAAWGTGVPVVSSLISTPYDRARFDDPRVSRWKLAAARWLDGFTARHCTARLHAVSEGAAAANARDLGTDRARITVVERGRPLDEFTVVDDAGRTAARARLSISAGDRVVLGLGRIAFQKGFPDLVRAVPALVAAVPDARVLIAGAPGPATPDLDAALAALPVGMREHVEVLGYRSDVLDLLHAADVFVMPSRWEGTAGAVLEAMACGLPVVATRVDGLQGVVADGQDAVLVDVGDSAALARALTEVLTDGELARRLGARGRATVVERFSMERAAPRMADLYREIAAQGPRANRR